MSTLRLIFVNFIVLFLFNTNLSAETLAVLLQQGQENLASGHYYEVNDKLQQLQVQATQEKNAYTVTLAKGLQGYLAFQQQNYLQAESILIAAFEQAQKNSWNDLSVRFAVYLGEFYIQQQNLIQAKTYFALAENLAAKINDKSFLISCLINQAKLALAENKTESAWQALQQAQTLLENLPQQSNNSALWLSLGYQLLQLYQKSETNPSSALTANNYLSASFYALDKALQEAKQFNQRRTQALALQYLAMLYQQQQPKEAIKLILKALALAQQDNADDILLDLEWQLAKLYTPNDQLQAITAYRQALKLLEKNRLDIPVAYQKGISSFKMTFAPLYLGLADLLLQQSSLESPQQQQILLHEAEATIESMKKSEMEDYFQSRCEIPATPLDLKKTDPHAAALYPIALPDRLELIVETATGLQRFTSPVTANELAQQARQFGKHLRNYDKFKQSKTQALLLYQWLIAPIDAFLKQQHIETLIYIPDGALRLVPLAALYDGKKFVIENYAVVTSPGMTLIASEQTEHQQRMLLAGMSLPGDVIRDLPNSLLLGLVVETAKKSTDISVVRDLKQAVPFDSKRELTVTELQNSNLHIQELLNKPEVLAELQKSLALSGVTTEIKQLAQQYQSNYLLNEDFSLEKFTTLLQESPHDILHIASHGFFGSTAEDSFVMTHNKLLTLPQFEALLNSDYIKKHPIDLLILSACETAEGNDRSPLGISGVAIKAKVHSALGSLWPVSDVATAQLMTTFYATFSKTPNKAKALQEAMISLLKQPKFANPARWSSFILIGNWQ